MKDIIQKIQKLLALSESSNEHEAQAAMLKAQEMLIKHNLTMGQVKDKEDAKPERLLTDHTFKSATWKIELAEVVADNFRCYTLIRRDRTNRIIFLGLPNDVEVCNMIYTYAVNVINKEVQRLKYHYRKQYGTVTGLESSYASGFTSGLADKYEKQKEENAEWGLILVKPVEVIKEYKEIKNTAGSVSFNVSRNNFDEAFLKGYKDGGNFSITEEIEGGEI